MHKNELSWCILCGQITNVFLSAAMTTPDPVSFMVEMYYMLLLKS